MLERKKNAKDDETLLMEFEQTFNTAKIVWERPLVDIINDFLKGSFDSNGLIIRISYNLNDWIIFQKYIDILNKKREIESHSLTIQEYLLLCLHHTVLEQENKMIEILLMLEKNSQGIEDQNVNLLMNLAFLYAFTLDRVEHGRKLAEQAWSLGHPSSHGFFALLESDQDKKIELFEKGLSQGDYSCFLFLCLESKPVQIVGDPEPKKRIACGAHQAMRLGFLDACIIVALDLEEKGLASEAEKVWQFYEAYNTRRPILPYRIMAYAQGKGPEQNFTKVALLCRENYKKLQESMRILDQPTKNKITKAINSRTSSEIPKLLLETENYLKSLLADESIKNHPTYPGAVYHSILFFFEQNKLENFPHLIPMFNNLALEKPQEFDAFCAQDSWEMASSILDVTTAKIVANRKKTKNEKNSPQILAHLSLFFPTPIANIVCDYVAGDIYPEKLIKLNELVDQLLAKIEWIGDKSLIAALKTELILLKAKFFDEHQHLDKALQTTYSANHPLKKLFRLISWNGEDKAMADSLRIIQKDLIELRKLLEPELKNPFEPGDSKSEPSIDFFNSGFFL